MMLMCSITKIWRNQLMNDEAVESMIQFVESKERELQASKLTATQNRTDVVKAILDELERVSNHENK